MTDVPAETAHIALEAPTAPFAPRLNLALLGGATPVELVRVLVAAAPQTAIPRIVATASALLEALGVDEERPA